MEKNDQQQQQQMFANFDAIIAVERNPGFYNGTVWLDLCNPS